MPEGDHRLVLHREFGHHRRGVRQQYVGSALRGDDLFRLDEAGMLAGQGTVAREQFRRAFGMQREQPVSPARGDLGGNRVDQVRRSAYALGEGGREHRHLSATRGMAHPLRRATILPEQRVQLGPARLHHREVAMFPGQPGKRHRRRRSLRAVQVEQPADAEVPALVGVLAGVEAMEQLHLGPGEERRYPVHCAQHGPWIQRNGRARVHHGHGPRHALPRFGQRTVEPGMHAITCRLQRLRQRLQDRQRVALTRREQHIGHDRAPNLQRNDRNDSVRALASLRQRSSWCLTNWSRASSIVCGSRCIS